MLFAQIAPPSFWNEPAGSTALFLKIAITLVIGIAAIFALMNLPTNLRRPVVVAVTFLSGLFYVVYYVFPKPVDRQKDEMPRNVVESASFWLDDALPVVANFTIILSAFLLGLGIYSLLRVHGRRLIKMQKDWAFSLILIVSMFTIVAFGYWDWWLREFGSEGVAFGTDPEAWPFVLKGKDLLFDGMLQQMDAAMFSIIAFYILSAAYRAFRIRSIEATILLATALLMIFSLMGLVEAAWGSLVNPGGDPNSFQANFTLTSISQWVRNSVQTAAIRGIDFGVGIGALAMGLRLWLSLEKSNAGGGS